MGARSGLRAASIALAVLGTATSRGVERVRLTDAPTGVLSVDTGTRIQVRGFSGEIRIRLGSAGQVRYHRSGAQPPRTDLPVDVWRAGSVLEMTPPEAKEPGRSVLEASVPPGMSVEIDAKDAKVVTQGLRSDLQVHGARLEIDSRGTEGPVAVDVQEGRVWVDTVAGDLRLSGGKLQANVVRVVGKLDLSLTDSTVEAQSVGSVEADLETTSLKVSEIPGTFRLRAHGGAVEIRRMQKGGELLLAGTSVLLQESQGDVDVQTDADVRFVNTDIDLHVDGYGGSVRGNGNTGLLEVKTTSAEVTIGEVSGPTRIAGEGLKVELQHVSGDIFVEVASSDVSIEDASSEILVLSQNGNVAVNRAATEIEVRSAGGDVRLLDVHGPLAIQADGDQVEISLAHPFAITDSIVRNDGGAVEIRMPPALGIRLLAETRFGRIENGMPVRGATDDASAVELEIGPQGGDRATLRVFAARDIVLAPR